MSRAADFLHGSVDGPVWERPARYVLIAFTALLYTWGLDRNGWANAYYSAAAASGAGDWTGFFFGSFDPGNAITVDKPPLSVWIMASSVRIFGLNPWSILVPQATMGVLSVYLLYSMVRKRTDAATGLLAGAFLAVTPVATVMFRYNNPDALLTLLLIGIALFTLEAVDRHRFRWLIVAGFLTGAAVLTKQLQVLLLLPAVALTYLVFAQASVARRFLHLTGALAAAGVAGGWWFLLVQLTNPSRRPFIGGSQNNSAIELTLGYNGLDRLTGDGANKSSFTDIGADAPDVGFLRFLQADFAGQFAWFLPLAVAGLCLGIWQVGRRQDQPAKRALLLLSCAWFVSALTVVAFMTGIVHPYYVLSAVPPLCSLAAVALMYFVRGLPERRIRFTAALTLACCMLLALLAAFQSAADFPFLTLIMLVVWSPVIAAVLLRLPGPLAARVTAVLLTGALFLGPVLWSLTTVVNTHEGAAVLAGPGILGSRMDDRRKAPPGMPASLSALVFGEVPHPALLDRLRETPSAATWASAVVGAETAANYQLAAGKAVLPLGGFDGKDPFPTLEQFKVLVDGGRVGSVMIQTLPPYTVAGQGEPARIVAWVRDHYTAELVGGAEFYNLAP